MFRKWEQLLFEGIRWKKNWDNRFLKMGGISMIRQPRTPHGRWVVTGDFLSDTTK